MEDFPGQSRRIHSFELVPLKGIYPMAPDDCLDEHALRMQLRDQDLTIDALSAACIDLTDENTELKRQLVKAEGTEEWLKRLCVLAFVLTLVFITWKTGT